MLIYFTCINSRPPCFNSPLAVHKYFKDFSLGQEVSYEHVWKANTDPSPRQYGTDNVGQYTTSPAKFQPHSKTFMCSKFLQLKNFEA